jgi:hypothetical protein
MGESFVSLAVQRFHKLAGLQELHGWVDIDAPSTPAARLLALCLGTPIQATSGPLRFELQAAAEAETWTRHFPRQKMTSRMHLDARRVVEQLGAARLTFALCEAEGRLEMQLMGCTSWDCHARTGFSRKSSRKRLAKMTSFTLEFRRRCQSSAL